MKKPKVSIIIPCFNYGDYLKYCLNSIIENKFNEDKEIIIIDDGSTDNTKVVSKQFSEKSIRYIYQKNSGLSAARNTGIDKSSGEYIIFLDADDLLLPDTIQSQVSFLDENSNVDIAICQNYEMLSMHANGPLAWVGIWPLVRNYIPFHLCHFNIAPPHAFIIRRKKMIQIGKFDTKLKACEDYDFWFRCLLNNLKFAINEKTYVIYRKHASSMSHNKNNQYYHDYKMHLKVFYGIKNNQYLNESNKSWIAHAAGCLITADRMSSIKYEITEELIQLALQSIIEFAKKTKNSKKEKDYFVHYYICKILLAIQNLNPLASQYLNQIIKIISRLYPDYLKNRQELTHQEQKLAHQIHHPCPTNFPTQFPSYLSHTKRILLGSDFFWPSIGGCENFIADLGTKLVDKGYEVHVVTRKIESRDKFIYNNMHIIHFECFGRFRDNSFGEQYEQYRHFIINSKYDSVFIIGQPDSWMHAPFINESPSSQTHLIPIINLELYNDWIKLHHESLVGIVLKKAQTCISLTYTGVDAQLIQAFGVKPVFIPHAMTPFPPYPGFRRRHGLKTHTPLLVHVANFWPVKNQLELVKTMMRCQGDWQLVMIGSALPWPNEKQYYESIVSLASQDPRIHIIGPLSPQEADAAIAEADILLLSSKAECRPLVIIQAMHHGTPWIATPQCNSVYEDAGGIICTLDMFPKFVQILLDNTPLRITLGAIGKELWHQCFSWDKVLPLFLELIEHGRVMSTIKIPNEIQRTNDYFVQKIQKAVNI